MSAAPVSFREHDDEDLSADEVGRRYRTLIEQLPLVVYLDELDSVSSNIFTGRQIEPMLGYSVEEWATDPELFTRLLHPDDRERVLAAHAHTHETHEPLSIEYRLIARDGQVVHLRDEGVIVLDDHGKPLYLQGYLLDITQQREAEHQLRQLALYDPLTGLANRAFFHERLRACDQAPARRRHRRRGSSTSTSTTSKGSTTAGVTTSATRCCTSSASESSTQCAPATPPPASAATSSPSS